jgi:hypothetical protein
MENEKSRLRQRFEVHGITTPYFDDGYHNPYAQQNCPLCKGRGVITDMGPGTYGDDLVMNCTQCYIVKPSTLLKYL